MHPYALVLLINGRTHNEIAYIDSDCYKMNSIYFDLYSILISFPPCLPYILSFNRIESGTKDRVKE